MTILYGIKNCDTIKKVRAWLNSNEIDYTFHDFNKDGCPRELVNRFLQHFTFQELVNTRGTTWRKLPEITRSGLTLNSAIKLMSENSALIKRPLIETDGEWLLGFDENQLRNRLK